MDLIVWNGVYQWKLTIALGGHKPLGMQLLKGKNLLKSSHRLIVERFLNRTATAGSDVVQSVRLIIKTNSQVQNVKLGSHQTCLSINRFWHELCDMLRRLVGTTAPGHHDCSIQD
ncbi:hypothetical protein TNCV_2158241 [Trichonephila clavipes]|nr:hypothetical protein TNCV_2158241 [Trichonephila clavipes]